jgi:hypothetical protein
MPLVFRGLECSDVDGIFLEVTKGFRMPAQVRGDSYVVASKAGRIRGDRQADVLPLQVDGYVAGDDPADWAANRDALLAVLQEGEGIEPGDLVVTGPDYGLADGDQATVPASVVNVMEGPIEAYQRQTFSIALEAVDPPEWTLEEGS